MIVSAYLVSLLFFIQLTLGLMGFLMIGHLTGGKWTRPFRAVSEPFLRKIWILFALFLLVLILLPDIYHWSQPHEEKPAFFLNRIWFSFRAVVYWSIWIFLAEKLRPARKPSRLFCGLGLFTLLFTMSFAAFDWMMTLEPAWSATGYGVAFIAGSLVSSMSFASFLIIRSKDARALLNDFGNLLLMGSLFWIYIHFLQYLILWSGQIPREMEWYELRFAGLYLPLLLITLLGTFLLPLPLLLFKKFKNNPQLLAALTLVMLTSRVIEIFVEVMPTQIAAASGEILKALCTTIIVIFLMGTVWLKVPYAK